MKLEDVMLLEDKENYSIWNKIDSSNPSELINISLGEDEGSVAKNIDEFIKRFNSEGFFKNKSLFEILSKENFTRRDFIINSFRKYRFIIFDDFKENYDKFKDKQEYFTLGALVDDIKTSNLDIRICLLLDYIYSQDNYALTVLFGFNGIYVNKVTKELIDLYDSSVYPCLKIWELLISGNKEIDNFLEERKVLAEKIPYKYSDTGDIISYSISIEDLYKLMDKEEEK